MAQSPSNASSSSSLVPSILSCSCFDGLVQGTSQRAPTASSEENAHKASKERVEEVPRRSNEVGLFYDPAMAGHRCLDDSTHPEQPLRIIRIFERLEAEGFVERCKKMECRAATRDQLELKHSKEHVENMLSVQGLTDSEANRFAKKNYNSVYLCPESTQAGLLAAGSVIEATAKVCAGEIGSAVCVVRPPGHHAEPVCAMGFCIFANVSLAAAEARRQNWSERILIVDWDIHHGNGTQSCFEDDPSVLVCSIHRYDNGTFYPAGDEGNFTSVGIGDGVGYNVNVPWDVRGGKNSGSPPPGDAEYALAFERVVLRLAEDFQPDLILVSAGFDAALGDPLGGCKVTPAGYHHLTKELMKISSAKGRIVVALEGGYNLESISLSMAACTCALLGDDLPTSLEMAAALDSCYSCNHGATGRDADAYHRATVEEVRSHVAQFWPSMRGPEWKAPADAGVQSFTKNLKNRAQSQEADTSSSHATPYPEISYGAETPEKLQSAKMEKKMREIRKEGGKRGVEIEGTADMGGLQFFCTVMDKPNGDADMLYESLKATNEKSDPTDDERKGGSGRIGKMLVSKDQEDSKLALVAYVPPDKQEELKASEWMGDILKALGGGRLIYGDDTTAKGLIENDADKGLFVLKLKDSAISESINYLKAKDLFPDKVDDSDDDFVFGDDDFP